MKERQGRWLPGKIREDGEAAAALATAVAAPLADFFRSFPALPPETPRSIRQERIDEAYEIMLAVLETRGRGSLWTNRPPGTGGSRSAVSVAHLAARRHIRGGALTHLASRALAETSTPTASLPAAELQAHWTALLAGHGRTSCRPPLPPPRIPGPGPKTPFPTLVVEDLLRNLPLGKAVGPDRLPGELLHAAPRSHALWVKAMFEWFWAEGLVPSLWRYSYLHPIYKGSGPRSSGANYRGISLMSHLRKCFESGLVRTLERTVGPRCDSQHGFTAGRSIWGPVWALHTELQADLAAGRSPQVLLVDFKKAYDTVDRSILWTKLASRGAQGSRILDVLRELTDDNVQLLRSSPGTPLRTIPCERGLPQGSSLSPVLYTYFIDDLPASLLLEPGASCRAYADDVAIRTSGLDPSSAELQRYCDRLQAYAAWHGFEVSTSKTELLGGPAVRIYDSPIPARESSRYLGVRFTTLGCDFDSTHRGVTETAARALRTLRARGLLGPGFDAERRLHLVKAFVLARMDFASGLPVAPILTRARRDLYHQAIGLAICGTDPQGEPLRPDFAVLASALELRASTGLLPWGARRGANAWQVAHQAAWAGVPWPACLPLLCDAPFLHSAPPPPPPASFTARLTARADRSQVIAEWAGRRQVYRPLGCQSRVWAASSEKWVTEGWVPLLCSPRPSDALWMAVMAASAMATRGQGPLGPLLDRVKQAVERAANHEWPSPAPCPGPAKRPAPHPDFPPVRKKLKPG